MYILETPARKINYQPGQTLYFDQQTLNPFGLVETKPQEITIKTVRNNGYLGQLIIPEVGNFIIKTSKPQSPVEELIRRIIWGLRDFPPAVDKTTVTMNHLATNLIADVIPVLTHGQIFVPHSLGWTLLPDGYSVISAQCEGRPPRYDNEADEFSLFRKVQKTLTLLGLELGLEQIAQVHVDNPFGMANLRINRTNSFEWVNTTNSLPGFVWPIPGRTRRFNQEINQFFYPNGGNVVFDRIHVDKFAKRIKQDRHLFVDSKYSRILNNLALYEFFRQKRDAQEPTPINLRATDQALGEVVFSIPGKVLALATSPFRSFINTLRDPDRTVFRGIEHAMDAGIISQQELEEIKSSVSADMPALRNTIVYFGVLKAAGVITELVAYGIILGIDLSTLASNPVSIYNLLEAVNQVKDPRIRELIAATYFTMRASEGLAEMAGAAFIGRRHKVNLKAARIVSGIFGLPIFPPLPLVGEVLSVVAQTASSTNNRSEIRHFAIRYMLSLAGGLGSESEGKLYKRFGAKLESFLDKITKNHQQLKNNLLLKI